MCTEKKSVIYLNQGPRKSRFHRSKFLPFLAYQQTDGQNIYRIDAHWLEETAQKKIDIYLNQRLRKSRFHLNLTYEHTDISNYIVALLRIIISSYRVDSLLISMGGGGFLVNPTGELKTCEALSLRGNPPNLYLNPAFSSEASLKILMSVHPFVCPSLCLSECPSGLGGNVIFSATN